MKGGKRIIMNDMQVKITKSLLHFKCKILLYALILAISLGFSSVVKAQSLFDEIRAKNKTILDPFNLNPITLGGTTSGFGNFVFPPINIPCLPIFRSPFVPPCWPGFPNWPQWPQFPHPQWPPW
jgi:hypothetical protein